ncbi:MAG: hypothetical protein M5U28_04380 [Sandaracinaceae bacterium]|nr:hypothetical protein [Sandaracinaceae bacterium]
MSDASTDGAAAHDASRPEDAGGLPRTCVAPEGADPSGTDVWGDTLGRATVTVNERGGCTTSYTLTTTAALRDGQPDNPRTVVEREGAPTVRSAHDLFDALHALALEEARELSVSSIRDGAFDDGRAVDCGGCFETGRLWNYVWTRDTAYAVDLGLAAIDPPRARASLEFKLSERRGGGNLQIVQDTGTGGSYPVSTDRVAWALGAEALLAHLTGEERAAFQSRAYLALRNTVEHDRRVAFDAEDGLYRGEQSFLDWREQTYPRVDRGRRGAHRDEQGARDEPPAPQGPRDHERHGARGRRHGPGRALRRMGGRAAHHPPRSLRLDEEGLFSTYVTTLLDPAPVRRYDLLSSAFAVLFGVASDAQAARILERYPHYGPGAPVIWPQQQMTAIYHNRGEWPFVTAYWLRAAKRAGNHAVAERMVRALIRGAAINLSNMENFEAATGAAWLEDGAYSGPVVNSQRQLWSVAGYLSMVHSTIFGLEPERGGLRVRPFVTRAMRRELFAGTDTIVLNDYPWRGRTVTVVLHLPDAPAGTEGAFTVASMQLNGASMGGDLLTDAMLAPANRVDVMLTAGLPRTAALTEVSPSDWRDVFGPRTPRITSITEVAGRLELALDRSGEAAGDVTWTIYRDGLAVAEDLPGDTATWTDSAVDPGAPRSPCYTAELRFASGNASQHAPPTCWWGRADAHIATILASDMSNVGGSPSSDHGRFHYEPWGDAGHSLTVSAFTPARSGLHLLQVTFGNGAGSINTGITCGIKRVVVEDAATSEIVAEGALIMPHLGTWSRWEDSSFVRAELTAGRTYRIVIRGDDEMINMSSFAHFEPYTGGLGGRSGQFNRVNIADLKVFAM